MTSLTLTTPTRTLYTIIPPAWTGRMGFKTVNSKKKTPPQRGGFFVFMSAAIARLPTVVLDNQRRLHLDRIGHVGELGPAHVRALHVLVVGGDVFGHVALGGLRGFQHPRHLLGLGRELDHVVVFHKVRSDVDPAAIHLYLTLADEPAAGKTSAGVLHAGEDR